MAVYGLGELLARGTGESVPTFKALTRLTKREVRILLGILSRVARAFIERKAHADVTCATLVRAGKMNGDVLQNARSFLSHPPHGKTGLYGYGHAVLALLASHPRLTATWLQRANLPPDLYTILIGKIVWELRYRAAVDGGSLVASLLQTGAPAFQAFGACALAGEGAGDAGLEFGPLLAKVQSLGVEAERAFILALIAAENARVSRAINEGKLEQSAQRLEQLARNPEVAYGGSRNAEGEIRRVSEWYEQQQATKQQIDQQFDRLVHALAASFGAEPALVRNMGDVQRALTIFAPEVLVNVGATLGNSPAAEPVFNAVIELGANVVGLNTPICFETDTELTLDEFGSIRAPMARAIALRYRIDTRGVGRRTGQLLSELSKAGDRLLGAPYAALRWPQQYRSALRRRMASVLIAIDVARAGTPQEQQANAPLMELAIDQAELLLKKVRKDIDCGFFSETVTQLAIEAMQAGQANDRRDHWRQNPEMDAFSRALAIWSQPACVRSNEDEAKALFLHCTELNLRRVTSSQPLVRALNLLDTGFAAAVQSGVTEAMQSLKVTWNAAMLPARIRGAERYADSFDLLSRAAENRSTREELIAHPVWKTSRTAVALASETDLPQHESRKPA